MIEKGEEMGRGGRERERERDRAQLWNTDYLFIYLLGGGGGEEKGKK